MNTNVNSISGGLSRRTILLRLPAYLAGGIAARATGAQVGKDNALVLGGTGSGVAPLKLVLDAGRVAASFVPNLGSSGGLKALAAGAIDVAVSARRLNDAERAAGLVEHEAFRTPFVWATHAAVPIGRVSVEQLVGLYAGRVERWASGEPVRLVLRPEADSDTLLVKALFPELGHATVAAAQRPGIKVAVTDDEAIGDIERIDGALGTTTLSMALSPQRNVRVLDLDGVAPSVTTLASGAYRPAKSIWLVTRGVPSGSASALLQLLAGKPGAALLARHGCLAVDPR